MSFDINQVRFHRVGDTRSTPARKPEGNSRSSADARPAAGDDVVVETNAALAEAGPPIDSDRVREIRKALSEGSYPLAPTKVADAIIAAKYMLSDL